MTFLAMIIGLLLLQLWGSDNPVQNDRWFDNVRERVDQWLEAPGSRLALAVLGPALAAMLLLDVLRPFMFGLLWIAAAALLLLYSFGRGDYHARVVRYADRCRQGRVGPFDDRRDDKAGDFPGEQLAPELSRQQVHDDALAGLLYAGYQRFFPLLFYFVLLGPAAALAYRLLQLCSDHYAPRHATAILHVLDWVPARLLALVFALTGDFVRSRAALQEGLLSTSEPARELLLRVAMPTASDGGAAARNMGEPALAAGEVEACAALLSRSAVVWVLAIALAEILL